MIANPNTGQFGVAPSTTRAGVFGLGFLVFADCAIQLLLELVKLWTSFLSRVSASFSRLS
jgi:hypothetical protein